MLRRVLLAAEQHSVISQSEARLEAYKPTPAVDAPLGRCCSLQADRQGRAADFAAAYAKSEFKTAAYAEIESQLNQASDLGGCCMPRLGQEGWWVLSPGLGLGRRPALCACGCSWCRLQQQHQRAPPSAAPALCLLLLDGSMLLPLPPRLPKTRPPALTWR